MKKRTPSLALALCLAALLLLFACGEQPGNTGPEPPVYGFYDTVTQTTFQLGDPKEKFDEAFGEPEVNEYPIGDSYLYFEDKSFHLSVNKENNASTFFFIARIHQYSPDSAPSVIADRFEFHGGFKLGLSRDTMRRLYGDPDKFIENESAAIFTYYRDAEGNPTDTWKGDDNYIVTVSTWNNQIGKYQIS